MNNKGTTLIEILVSVILITMVTIFLFAVLSDLRNEEYLSESKSKDALNRTEIIHIIENDFINLGLKDIQVKNCSNNLCATITFKDDTTKQLKITQTYLKYDGERWDLTGGKYLIDETVFYACSNFNGYSFFRLTVPTNSDAASFRKSSFDISYLSEINFTTNTSLSINGKNNIIRCT